MKETKYKKAIGALDEDKSYSTEEALELILKQPKRKFQETVDISVWLGIDPKKSEQNIRGSLTLPNSLGKEVKVAAFVDSDKVDEAKKSGADFIGLDDLIEKYKDGNIDFDVAITTPDQMKNVSKLAKVLGPKGLMPSPKSGTVTENIDKAVKEIKHGQVRFKAEQEGIVQGTIANVSMKKAQLLATIDSLINELNIWKPASSTGI